MFARAGYGLIALVLMLGSISIASAQQYAPQPVRRAFAQQELDQMLAPIALYPDALLSQILMAATYPDDVVEAARWSRRNPDLAGDRAVRAVERMDWDPSVKSLTAFPQILDMMDQKIDWTEDLGDAFLDQRGQVMDTVQYLRDKAYAAGNLRSTDQFRVDYEGASFSITLWNPEMVYVPYYDPLIVYGTWWWPTHRPVYWAPWPGYHARPGYARAFAWGPGIPVARGFFFGAPDWHRRTVNIVNVNAYYYRPARADRPREAAPVVAGRPGVWQHDAAHRSEAMHRNPASRGLDDHRGQQASERREWRERERPAASRNGPFVSANESAGSTQPEVRNAPAPSTAPVAAQPAVRNAPVQAAASHTREPVGRYATVQPAAPAAVARSQVRSAPAQWTAPAAASQPVIREAPAPPGAPAAAVAGRPGVEQRPVMKGAPVRVAQRTEPQSSNANAREHQGHHSAPSSESNAPASSGSPAPQGGGNWRASGGNFHRP